MKHRPVHQAFTLVEVLVAASVIVVLMGILLGMTDQTQRLMRSTSGKVEQFQEARVAFESMTRRLSQATLNTFWEYEYNNKGIPTRYQRSAELRFISGTTSTLATGGSAAVRPGQCVFFHAPNGLVEDMNRYGSLDNLINAWGYFVEVGTDENSIPEFLRTQIPPRRRYRLMEFMQPSEQLRTYEFQNVDPASPDGLKWFAPLITAANRPVRTLAQNVVGLFILPRLSRADEELWRTTTGQSGIPILTGRAGNRGSSSDRWRYDTRTSFNDATLNPKNQLPPVVQVAVVAIDEPSARTLEDKFGGDRHLGLDYSNMFRDPRNLEDNPNTPKPGDGDLANLEALLTSRRAAYRIFATNVNIRGSKWSRSQEN